MQKYVFIDIKLNMQFVDGDGVAACRCIKNHYRSLITISGKPKCEFAALLIGH